MLAGDGSIWLHPESPEFGLASPRSVGATTASVVVMVDDVDAHHRHAAARGADVVYAPGLARPEDIATVVREVDVPVNVLLRPGGPTVAELADLGVARISVGGAFAFAGLGALEKAARGLLDGGLPPWDDVAAGAKLARRAFGS